MDLVKSCVNYTGGKYSLLKQLLPLFPKNVNAFIDLFCGGGNVALNITGKQILCYDNNHILIDLFNFIKNKELGYLLNSIDNIISKYNLSNSEKYGYNYYDADSYNGLANFNRNKYLKLREDFNKNISKSNEDYLLYFYTLIIYGFNNQIRFNKKGFYNIPVGKRDFNSNLKNHFKRFSKTIKEKNIKFVCSDFRNIDLNKLTKNDFVYVDPPYLISTAPYNEQGGWTYADEKDLLNILDELNSNNIKFALSNVLESKDKKNNILINWSEKYNINYLSYNYNNSNYQIKNKKSNTTEVLICNY